jgi:S-adenosylmethionine:tRNA ribosyltransferase-isomerase
MKLAEFDYQLPDGLIAQAPASARDESRLMVLGRETGVIRTALFKDLPLFLREGDLLVVNDTRVIPCRLYGRKDTGAEIEILLLRERGKAVWEALLRPGKRVRENTVVRFGPEGEALVREKISAKAWLLEFRTGPDFETFLKLKGRAPLPPYIKRSAQNEAAPDIERYQTLFARVPGSVAAPTAGLHFTGKVLAQLESRGVSTTEITLHVGYGTFLPITVENVEDHEMEEEFFEIGVRNRRAKRRGC